MHSYLSQTICQTLFALWKFVSNCVLKCLFGIKFFVGLTVHKKKKHNLKKSLLCFHH